MAQSSRNILGAGTNSPAGCGRVVSVPSQILPTVSGHHIGAHRSSSLVVERSGVVLRRYLRFPHVDYITLVDFMVEEEKW